MASFASLGISPLLVKVLEEQKIKKATPIQAEVIPAILWKRDVLGISKTGSGKTISYVLPILMSLFGKTELKNRQVPILILVPTRELAIQVNEVFKSLISVLPNTIKSLAVYGGVSINVQMLEMQNTHILIATPGRLIELVQANAVKLNDVNTLVIDEADKLLNDSFAAELNKVIALLPAKRQNLLFSATLNKDIENLESVMLNNPLVIKIQEEVENLVNIELINQVAYLVKQENKGPLLRYLIKQQNITQALVFTSSIYQTNLVAEKLNKNGIHAAALHSDKSMGARKENLKQFKEGKLQVLVATDLLSRGIDIAFLPYVINYDLPRSPKDFIHRIGRTGRAENAGKAISFITQEDEPHFKVIQKKMKRIVNLIDANNLNPTL